MKERKKKGLLLGYTGMTDVKWKLSEAGILSSLLTAVSSARKIVLK